MNSLLPILRRGAEVFLVAALYFISGRLGLLLAIPPGYATAVFPAAGVALTALLLRGYSLWPGVMLGSFLINLSIGYNPDAALLSIIVAGGIGLSAAVQAVVGAVLIRRWIDFPTALTSLADNLLLLTAGGPLACLVNAVGGPVTLWLAGIVSSANLAFTAGTWWVGDTIGVIVFTPLLLIWLMPSRLIQRRRQIQVTAPLVILFALVIGLFVYASNWEQQRIEQEFQRQADGIYQNLSHHFDLHLETLRAIQSFYAASRQIERNKFAVFTNYFLTEYPSIHALSWNPLVTSAQRIAFEETMRREGFPGFQITERDSAGRRVRAGERAEYFAVNFIEPFSANEAALGFDVASEPVRSEAVKRARQSCKASTTGPIKLIQEKEEQYGVLIFQPIFTDATQTELRGLAVIVLRVVNMAKAILRQTELSNLTAQIRDETSQTLLYATSPQPAAGFHRIFRYNLAGRIWQIEIAATPDYLTAHRSWQAWSFLAGGLIFTALLGAFLLVVTGHTANVEEIVTRRTRELSETATRLENEINERGQAENALRESEERQRLVADATLDAYYDWDMVTDKVWRNRGYIQLFGHPTEIESTSDWWRSRVHPDDLVMVTSSITSTIAQRTTVWKAEYRFRRRNDEFATVFDRGLLFYDADGKPVRFLGAITDLTDRKQAEKALRHSEERLELFFNQSLDGFFFMMLDAPVRWNESTDKSKMLDYIFSHQRVTEVNEAMLIQYRATREQFIGLTPNDLFKHNIAAGRVIWHEFFDNGHLHIETDERRFDGTQMWIEGDYICMYNAEGLITGHFGVQREVTARKQVDAELRLHSEILRNMAEGIHLTRTRDSVIVYANPTLETMFGYEPGELIGRHVSALNAAGPKSPLETAAEINAQLDGSGNWHGEVYNIRKDGAAFWCQVHISTLDHAEYGQVWIAVHQDITARKKAESELYESRAFLRSIVENIPNMIFVKEARDLRFVELNRAGEKLIGLPKDRLIGHNDYDFFPKAEADFFIQKDRETLAGGQLLDIPEETINTATLGPRILHTYKIPIHDAAGQPKFLLGISEDITERKRTEEALRIAKEQADAANKAKSVFLANMSHELRTPLNGILGFAQILKRDSAFPAAFRAAIETIERSGEHLLKLITDILDLAKIEAGKVEQTAVPFDLPIMLRDIIEMNRARTENKGLQLTLTTAPGLPRFVIGDEKHLRQIIINLIGNAIKFTAQGRVELRVSDLELRKVEPLMDNPQSNTIRFEIIDTGVGMTAEDTKRLFQEFSQVGDTAKKTEGTGLGLVISERLAQLMGSHIQVTSKSGQGTTFWFDIALPHDPNAAEAPAIRPATRVIGVKGRQPTVLIVDDITVNRKVVRALLKSLTIPFIEAENGQEAVEQALRHRPDVILMDWVMPVMDGPTATREIRRIQELKDTIVIALTANAFQEAQNEAQQAGCDDFLTKPVNIDKLLECLSVHLKIEWQYEDSAAKSTKPVSEINWPPADILRKLIEMANNGDLTGLDNLIRSLRQQDADYRLFTDHIQKLLDDFLFAEMITQAKRGLNRG